MNRRTSTTAIIAWAFLATLGAGTAAAWGPVARTAVVTSAARLLAKENAIPLTNLLADVKEGSEISEADLRALMPTLDTDPVGLLASEMSLLQAVRSDRVDPYLAYRMGVLGRVVASMTATMRTARPSYRTQYYADVDGSVANVKIESSPRNIVDASLYFRQVQDDSEVRQPLIEKDYEDGLGFRGLASQSLSQDVSRSINAVADVWWTILQGQSRPTSISEAQLARYHESALAYYIARGNPRETNDAYQRLSALGIDSPDMLKRIGDMFYDAGNRERAIQEYRAVLEKEPGRRDASERIAQHFVAEGDRLIEEGRVEQARDAYQEAVLADQLNTAAKEKVLDAERLLTERHDRLAEAQGAIDVALGLEKQAEDLVRLKNLAEATARLEQARDVYASVTDEFPQERRAAEVGFTNAERRLREVTTMLLSDAQNFSGTGGSADIALLVRRHTPELARETLLKTVERDYARQVQQMTAEMRRRLESE